MSKLIVEMEMPKCCAKCPLSERTTAWDQKDDKGVVGYACDLERSFLMREDDAAKARAYGCPIKGVLPEHHGDLIDRDELRKMNVFSQEFNRYVVPMMYIEDAKPIIEAERKTE